MYEKIILAPGIVLYKTDSQNANAIKELMESSLDGKWNAAMGVNTDTYENEINMARKCLDYAMGEEVLNFTNNSLQELYKNTDAWIAPAIEDFCNMYSVEKVVKGPYIYLKYNYSDKFDFHIDDGKKYPRTVSVSAYLNDNYTGGEIEFNHFGVKHKPNTGDLVVFSSSFPYMHRVHPVIDGTRYAIVNWYRYSGYPAEMP